MEEDLEIGCRIWLKKQTKLAAMTNEGGANVKKQLAYLTTMIQKMSLQFKYFQEQQLKKIGGEISEGNNERQESPFKISPLKLEVKFDLLMSIS